MIRKLFVLLFLVSCSTRPHMNKEGVSKADLQRVQFHFIQSDDAWLDVSFHREKWFVPEALASGLFGLSVTGVDQISKALGGLTLGGFISWGGYTWLSEVDKGQVYELDKCLDSKSLQQKMSTEFKATLSKQISSYVNTGASYKLSYDDHLEKIANIFSSNEHMANFQVAIIYQLNFAREDKTGDPMPQIIYRMVIYDDLKEKIIHDELRVSSRANIYSYSWELLKKNNCGLVQNQLSPLVIQTAQDICKALGIKCRQRKTHTSSSRWGRI